MKETSEDAAPGGPERASQLHFTALDLAEMGMMLAMIEAGKRMLDFLPNVELVTFFFIIFTLTFGLKTIAVAFAFTAIETALFGISSWVIMYLYIWPMLILIVRFTRKYASVYFYSILSAVYGLTFGALCAIPYLVVGGWTMAFTWWVAGIPYDILHGVSNFVICLILYRPVMAAMKKVKNAGDRVFSA